MRNYAERASRWYVRWLLLRVGAQRCFSSDRNRVIVANAILYAVGIVMIVLVLLPR